MMRVASIWSLSTIALVATIGCGETPQVGADALWQVRCAQSPAPGTTACSTQGMPINVLEFDGQDGVTVDCSVIRRGDNNIVTARVVMDSSHSFSIDGLTVTSGGAVASPGRVRIVDGDNTFAGQAGGAVPSDITPCQVSSFRFLDECEEEGQLNCRSEGPAMSFSLLCRNIKNENTEQIRRDFVFPDDAMQGAAISVFNCAGL